MAKDLEQVRIVLAGVKSKKVYAIGQDKAECMRKLQNIYLGKLDEKTRKRVGKTTQYNSSDILPETMKFYWAIEGW